MRWPEPLHSVAALRDSLAMRPRPSESSDVNSTVDESGRRPHGPLVDLALFRRPAAASERRRPRMNKKMSKKAQRRSHRREVKRADREGVQELKRAEAEADDEAVAAEQLALFVALLRAVTPEEWGDLINHYKAMHRAAFPKKAVRFFFFSICRSVNPSQSLGKS